MSVTPVASFTVPAVPPALGGDTGDPSPAAVVTAAPESEVNLVPAVSESVPAVLPASDDGTVDTSAAAIIPDQTGGEQVVPARNELIAEDAPPGPMVVSGASVASAMVSPSVTVEQPDKQRTHPCTANDNHTLGPLDRALLNVLGELRNQAQQLRDHSRRMKHHKKLCFALGDKAATVVSKIVPPFGCVLFRTDIALDSEILFKEIRRLFTVSQNHPAPGQTDHT